MKEIILRPKYKIQTGVNGEYYGELTEYMDRFLISSRKKMKRYLGTYVMSPLKLETWGEDILCIIRVPGATRGKIVVDEENIVKEIVIYPDSALGCVRCYQKSILKEKFKKFIGCKLIFLDEATEMEN